MLSRPTTAGISIDRATIAVWEVFPPMSVANPSTLSIFICAVSAGDRSAAMMTTLSPISRTARFFPGEIREDPLSGILDIADAPPEVVILHPVEDLPVFVDRHPDSPFGIDGHLPDILNRLVDEFPILQDHDMDIDDIERVHPPAQIARVCSSVRGAASPIPGAPFGNAGSPR